MMLQSFLWHSTLLLVVCHKVPFAIASSRGGEGPPPPPPPASDSYQRQWDYSYNDQNDVKKYRRYNDQDDEYYYPTRRTTDRRNHHDIDDDDVSHHRRRRHISRTTSRSGRYYDDYDPTEETSKDSKYYRMPPDGPPPPPPPPPDVRTSSAAANPKSKSTTLPIPKPKSNSFFNPFRKRTSFDIQENIPSRTVKQLDTKRDDKQTVSSKSTTSSATYNPIDYQFPSKSISDATKGSSTLTQQDDTLENEEILPLTGNVIDENQEVSSNRQRYPKDDKKKDDIPRYASARQDAIARYRSTKLGKIQLGMSSFLVGSAIGGFAGQSILNHHGKIMALLFGFMFWIMSLLRNDYGEMSRALGLGFIYLLQRTKAVRKRYRTGQHIRSMCRIGRRRPFPPLMNDNDDNAEENPWRYVPRSRDDPDFEMAKALLSVVLIGSFVGGSMPLIPTWMGSTGGAAAFAVFAMGKNARGDLLRTMGMRVVALTGEAMRINSDLNIASKVLTVGGKIFDKIMIMDRKHRIKDRLVGGAAVAYDLASRTFNRVRSDIQEGNARGPGRRRRLEEEEEEEEQEERRPRTRSGFSRPR